MEVTNQKTQSLMDIQTAPITAESIRKFLCPTANDHDLNMVLSICKAHGMNPFIGDCSIVKHGDYPAVLISRKDWFFKLANAHPDYRGIESGIIVLRANEIVYQNGAFILDTDKLLGGWSIVHRDGRIPHRTEVSLREYIKTKKDGTVTDMWNQKEATMICKVAKVQGLRESFIEKLQGVYDEAELGYIESARKSRKPEIEMPKAKSDMVVKLDQGSHQITEITNSNDSQIIDVITESSGDEEDSYCASCGVVLTKKVSAFSVSVFKAPLCMICQKKAKSNG